MFNPLLLIDAYKIDHRRQYMPGTEAIYSNFTPRGSRIPDQNDVVALGFQYLLQRYFIDELQEFFLGGNRNRHLLEYQRRVDAMIGPNTVGTRHLAALHDLGYLPLEVRAVPEGSSVPVGMPMLTVENTHPDFFWLPNYYETLLSCVLWLPCTSGTTAKRYRRLLSEAARKTGVEKEFVNIQAHDFSFRGMGGPEAAALSGMGHLLYFTGTDTFPAVEMIERYYGDGLEDGYRIAGSVPATEHSVMTAGICADHDLVRGEEATFRHLLTLYPTGTFSVVADTMNLWTVLTHILPRLKEEIMRRDGTTVIRPDSGDPVKIICGDPNAPKDSPAHKGVIELLWDLFGGTTTATGYRLLDSHIGCIYGDSISYERAERILAGLVAKGFASGNIIFGVGSFTFQFVTRDTYNFAMKATWGRFNGEARAMWKRPITDAGGKFSARGRLAVVPTDGKGLQLIQDATPADEERSILRPVWRDGKFLYKENFQNMRFRALFELFG